MPSRRSTAFPSTHKRTRRCRLEGVTIWARLTFGSRRSVLRDEKRDQHQHQHGFRRLRDFGSRIKKIWNDVLEAGRLGGEISEIGGAGRSVIVALGLEGFAGRTLAYGIDVRRPTWG